MEPPDAPVCAVDREELLGALKHETLQLKCEVDASPPAESFHWTFNSSGEQTELPSRLHSSENCSVSNQSADSLHIECIEGFDGGLPQMFLLELVEVPVLRLVRNLSLQHPPVQFFIDNLEPGSSYRIILFAANAKGRSEPVIIDDITFKGVAKYTGKGQRRQRLANDCNKSTQQYNTR
uniref:Ig-like domain-containing protein n=1 Tax=Anopheles melas TaxID=34690 RepID=A0A182UA33_9DIPT